MMRPRIIHVTQRREPRDEWFVVDGYQVDFVIVDLLEKRFDDIIRISVRLPAAYVIPLDGPEYGLSDEELIRRALCPTYPNPCVCADPVTHAVE